MENWQTEELENCLSSIIDYRGKTPTKTSSGIPLITAKIVKKGRTETPNEFIAESNYKSWMTRGYPKIGDVILTTEAPLGEVAQIKDEKVALAQRIILLRGKENYLDNTYLKYFLMSDFGQSELTSRQSGTTVFGIKQSELRKIKITFPSFEEQKAIAKILSSLDDKIELNRQMNATLEAMARTVFKAWFVDFETVRANSENRPSESASPEIAKLFPSEFEESEIGLIPKGWEIQSIYESTKFVNGRAFKPIEFSEKDKGQPVIKIAELKYGLSSQTKFTERQFDDTYKVTNGDILFSWSGSPETSIDIFIWIGKSGWLNQHIFKVYAKRNEEREFVYFLLREFKSVFIEIAKNKQTTGLGHVTAQDLKRLKFIKPPETILENLHDQFRPLFNLIISNKKQNEMLGNLKDSLLTRLISGKLQVENIKSSTNE